MAPLRRFAPGTVVALLLCASCGGRSHLTIDMYDGAEFVDDKVVPVAATTFVVAFHETDHHGKIVGASEVVYELTIPDKLVGRLPLTVLDISGTRTVPGSPPKEFSGGTFTVIAAARGSAFRVELDLGEGAERLTARGVARPASATRPDIWPYDARPPQPSILHRILSAVGL